MTGTASRAMSRNGYSYAEGNPTTYSDPSGKYVGIDDLFAGAIGAIVGAASSYYIAGQMWDLMYSGKCGCDLRTWTQTHSRSEMQNKAALMGAAFGAIFGVFAEYAAPAAIGLGLVGVRKGVLDAVNRGKFTPCNVADMLLGALGVLGGAVGGLASADTAASIPQPDLNGWTLAGADGGTFSVGGTMTLGLSGTLVGQAVGALTGVIGGIIGENFQFSNGNDQGSQYPKDRSTKQTKNQTAQFNSEAEARQFARQKLGRDPIEVEPNKWRSQDGKWQYRAKPGDLAQGHIHLEQLDPKTGDVLQNYHLTFPPGTER